MASLGARPKAQNIAEMCGRTKYKRVLEYGAGEGSLLNEVYSLGLFSELYAVEISSSGIDRINERNIVNLKEAKLFDGYQIPYPDDFFDLVYCSHVIEHVEHPRLILRELKRISKRQIFEVPLDYKVGIDRNMGHCMKTGHINVYTPSLFKFLLRSEGFDILKEHSAEVSVEAVRFNWYRNLKLDKTLKREFQLMIMPVKSAIKKFVMGRKKFDEFENYTYTCLTEGRGELKIF
jgi:ubiquinone/menaquinone biosynthesis C-methylase UbiE